MKTSELICRMNCLSSELSEKQKAFESIKVGNIYVRRIPDTIIIKRVIDIVDEFKVKVEAIEIEQMSSNYNPYVSIYYSKLDYFDNLIVDGDKLVNSESDIQKLTNIFIKVMESTLSYNSMLATVFTTIEQDSLS